MFLCIKKLLINYALILLFLPYAQIIIGHNLVNNKQFSPHFLRPSFQIQHTSSNRNWYSYNQFLPLNIPRDYDLITGLTSVEAKHTVLSHSFHSLMVHTHHTHVVLIFLYWHKIKQPFPYVSTIFIYCDWRDGFSRGFVFHRIYYFSFSQ